MTARRPASRPQDQGPLGGYLRVVSYDVKGDGAKDSPDAGDQWDGLLRRLLVSVDLRDYAERSLDLNDAMHAGNGGYLFCETSAERSDSVCIKT